MKKIIKTATLSTLSLMIATVVFSQESDTTATEAKQEKDKRPVRSPFESGMLINNQTIVIPPAKTLEFDIQHRFGKLNSGSFDLIGLYAPSNIRLGLNFSIFDNLLVGIGTTKNNKLQDANVKWNILQQTRSGSMPVAVTYYGNMVIDVSDKDNFDKSTHRLSYFHQIIIARKFNKWLSLQISPSLSHYNIVDTASYPGIKHDNIVISTSGRVKLSPQTSIIFEYDHQLNAPESTKPNLGLGVEISTGSHAFQIFLGSFDAIINQRSNVFNTNDFTKGDLLLGFNITRLWGF